jgi:UDP-3-O-acyl-N-acetylglucosamine deacetylase
VILEGRGLFGGQKCVVQLVPSSRQGVRIQWRQVTWDIGDPKLLPQLCVHKRRVQLQHQNQTLSTLEHFLAAASYYRQQGVSVHVLQGDEFPILDGSAGEWDCVLSEFYGPPDVWPTGLPRAKFELERGQSQVRYTPGEGSILRSRWTEGVHQQEFELDLDSLERSWLRAKTFISQESWDCLGAEQAFPGATEGVGWIWHTDSLGQMKHREQVIPKLEFAKHKALDFLGDMQWLGPLPQGTWELENYGHWLLADVMQITTNSF